MEPQCLVKVVPHETRQKAAEDEYESGEARGLETDVELQTRWSLAVVRLTINGQPYTIKSEDLKDVDVNYSLVDYIRDCVGLKGTKIMCREGDCGICMVTVCTKDPVTGQDVHRGLNSCTVPLLGCDGWDVSTIESLGNRTDGYHPYVQKLVETGGTQCGFCSPGFVMNMNSLVKSRSGGNPGQAKLSSRDIEDSFVGNYCRCVGYRSILDAFKSFANNGNPEIENDSLRSQTPKSLCSGCSGKCPCQPSSINPKSIEDSSKIDKENNEILEEISKIRNSECAVKSESEACSLGCQGCPLSSESKFDQNDIKTDSDQRQSTRPNLVITLPNGQTYVTARNFQSVFKYVNDFKSGNKKFKFVAGHSASGISSRNFDATQYDAYIDINRVRELQINKVTSSAATLGAGNTLTSAIRFFHRAAQTPGFEYMREFVRHLRRVESLPRRNAETVAGNLVFKLKTPSFPADGFPLFEAVGATVNLASSPSNIRSFSLLKFLGQNVTDKLIVSLTFRSLTTEHVFRSFRVAKRYENCNPDLTAAMLFKVDQSDDFKVVEKPSIVFGGINANFNHAVQTENFLNGVKLGDIQTLQTSIQTLSQEVRPDVSHPPEASPKYRKMLARSLLYKMILGILGGKVKSIYSSGAEEIPRLLSSGQPSFPRHNENSPLYKPVHKLEAYAQVAGEYEYVNDIPPPTPDELFGVLVLSTVANAEIESIDESEALAVPGVVKFLKASDIPGKNDAMGFLTFAEIEPIFAEKKVVFAGQALGLIVAKNRTIGLQAANKVKVQYSNQKMPILTIDEALQKAKSNGTYDQLFDDTRKSQIDPSKVPKKVISGQFTINTQSHVQVETHVTLCRPNQSLGTMEVYSATQCMDHVQDIIARVLDMPNNKIKVTMRQLGGGFGAKQTRPSLIAAACALAAKCTNKPVRVVLDLPTNFELIGKRLPTKVQYEVGFDDEGRITNLKCQIISDSGAFLNETTSLKAVRVLQNCYKAVNWEATPGYVSTNTAPNTKNRAPGRIKGIAIMEYIIEHIAHELRMDPIQVRRNNFLELGDPIFINEAPAPTLREPNILPRLLDELEKTADLSKRKAGVGEFNRMNRWKKRGLSVCTMRYAQIYDNVYGVYLAIYHQDGTVVVQTGAIEMGQGLNTKLAQTVAMELGIGLDKIVVQYSDNIIGANSSISSGAQTSEAVCYAAQMATKELKRRIAKVKTENNLENASWEELIKACHAALVDLRADYFFTYKDVEPYDIYGVNCVEVELDVLTGEYKILRSDLLQDAGKSLNPEIDIGQTEGAYIYGAGLWTSEEHIYDQDSGRLLTNSLATYKPPFCKSIPEDFRVSLINTRPNPFGVLGSKATGEAPIALTCTIFLALKCAIQAARKDAGHDEWFDLDAPVTPERALSLCLTRPNQFSY